MTEGVTEEDLVQIANNFLLSSPPGEFLEVAIDVRALLPDDSILNATAPDTFREYNTEQMMQVKSPHNTFEVLICKPGEVGDGEYLDHRGKQVVLFDHIKQQVTGSRPIQAGDITQEVEPLRAAVEEQALAYAAEYYPLGAAGVFGSKEEGKTTITICMSASKFQGASFNNGRWRATWVASLDKNQIKLTGSIKIHIHYYEDGNVQLNVDYNKTININAGSGNQQTATEIIKNISKAEGEFQAGMETSYNTMSENTFKALRRILPITRNKIDWERIHKYRLGQEAVGGMAKVNP